MGKPKRQHDIARAKRTIEAAQAMAKEINRSMAALDRVLFIRADRALIAALDKRLESARAEKPGRSISRADVAREMLWAGLRVTQ